MPQPGLFKQGIVKGLITIAMYVYTTYASTTCSFVNQRIFKRMYESIQSVIKVKELLNMTIDLNIDESRYQKPFSLYSYQ